MRTLINSFLNFFWTALAFTPVFLIWWEVGVGLCFWIGLIVAFSLGFVPIEQFTLSRRRRFYEFWGVKYLRKWVQDGSLAKGNATVISPHDLKGYAQRMNMYELFHWQCFCFFLFTAVVGFMAKEYLLSSGVLVANLLYNFWPILLQQYNRLRLRKWL
jgi:hypothetical protein